MGNLVNLNSKGSISNGQCYPLWSLCVILCSGLFLPSNSPVPVISNADMGYTQLRLFLASFVTHLLWTCTCISIKSKSYEMVRTFSSPHFDVHFMYHHLLIAILILCCSIVSQ